MKTALIIGITGNFGYEMALALHAQGWALKALMRNPEKAPKGLAVTVEQGDVVNNEALQRVSEGVSLIVYAANPPYHRWQHEALSMLEPVAQLAESKKLSLVFPGNVYNFAPQAAAIDEQTRMLAKTSKGQIRIAMEQRLRVSVERGAQVLIVRAGDFIGPNTQLSWLDHMVKQGRHHTRLAMPHKPDHEHFWSYLPDLCANTAMLLEEPLSGFGVYHDTGLTLKTADWQQAFANNDMPLKSAHFPWWFFRCAALFSPLLREVLKMRYLWQQPVVLDGTKLRQALGNKFIQTPLSNIVVKLFGA